MKHSIWLTVGIALILSFCLAAPLQADAASKKAEKTTKTIVKKTSSKQAKSAKNSAEKSVKKAEAKKSNKTAGKTVKQAEAKKSAAKKDTNQSDEKSVKKTASVKQAADRDVWLKRARESEVLSGKASWYGKDFHNKATASGVAYDMHTFTAAHRTLPMGTVVKVTDQHNGKSVMVCVTDRGPYVKGRVIDVSYAAAKKLNLEKRGVCPVRLEVVSDEKGAPLKSGQAYFIKYGKTGRPSKVGPFKVFADAAAMHEALRQAHPDAELILEKASRP